MHLSLQENGIPVFVYRLITSKYCFVMDCKPSDFLQLEKGIDIAFVDSFARK